MKAAQIKKYGDSDVVFINDEAEKPSPSQSQVQVEVYSAGVNPVDWKVRKGYLENSISLESPRTMGMDFAGIVSDLGEGVTDFKIGDKVYGRSDFFGGKGAFAEFAVAKVDEIAPMPKGLDFNQAAALPLSGISALKGMYEHLKLSDGQKILIHGGAGGIGHIAIQIAKHLEAYVATTVAIDDLRFALQLGADEAFDYRNQKFEEIVHEYDAVFDTVGGETFKRSFRVLRKGGVIVSMSAQPDQELEKQYGVTSIHEQAVINRERLTKLTELVDQGAVKVHVDKVFPLDHAGEALARLESGHPRGKVVVCIKEG